MGSQHICVKIALLSVETPRNEKSLKR